jgi:hypothetical protein
MRVAMYIVGQERRLVNPPSQVVAGVRTVTTNMNGRDVLPRLSRPFAFLRHYQAQFYSLACANRSQAACQDAPFLELQYTLKKISLLTLLD